MRKNIDPHASLPAFEQSLIDDNLAPNTVRAYVKAVRDFLARFPALNKENLLRHRSALMERYSPKTVNQRVMAINRWLLALRRPQWRLKGVRLGRRSFVENVISQADYLYLSRRLRELGELRWHFVVRFLAATGARVSELVQLRVEHVRRGFVDLYTKGNKQRRIYIPLTLRTRRWRGSRNEAQTSSGRSLSTTAAAASPRGASAPCSVFGRKGCTSIPPWCTPTPSATALPKTSWPFTPI